MKKTIALALMTFSTLTAQAQTSEKPEISMKGFIDTYYLYNFNTPAQTADNSYRYYDTEQNQFTLNLAEITLEAKMKEVRFLVDFDFGPFADLNATTAPAGTAQVDESSKNIGQAVLTYKPENSRWQIDAGKMYTHVGLETVKSKDNFNYSRTTLFGYAGPFWHTGVHVGYDLIPARVQTSFYIYNGWNTNNDVNRSKTFGAQLKWTPSEKSTLIYNVITGPEKLANERDIRTVHDINGTFAMTDSLTLAFDALYGSEENASIGTASKYANWYGGTVMAKLQLSPKSYLSPRYEYLRDEDGFLLSQIPQTLQSFVVTYGHELAPGFETRAEIRTDISNESVLVGDSASQTEKQQTSALLALLLQF